MRGQDLATALWALAMMADRPGPGPGPADAGEDADSVGAGGEGGGGEGGEASARGLAAELLPAVAGASALPGRAKRGM